MCMSIYIVAAVACACVFSFPIFLLDCGIGGIVCCFLARCFVAPAVSRSDTLIGRSSAPFEL